MKVAVGFGDDMWALGLVMAELVTGQTIGQRINGEVPVSCFDSLLLEIVMEVAGALGDSSQLFQMFTCLLHKDPALRLSAHQMQAWLHREVRPADVVPNHALLALLGRDARPADLVSNQVGVMDAQPLAHYFKKHRLERFAPALAEQGYECVEDLAEGAEGGDFDDSYLASLGMQRGYIRRFRTMLAEMAASRTQEGTQDAAGGEAKAAAGGDAVAGAVDPIVMETPPSKGAP